MQCPECQSSYVNKNGHRKGKQNYICVNCARQFIDRNPINWRSAGAWGLSGAAGGAIAGTRGGLWGAGLAGAN